jgi:glc operon protein GlcG
MRNFGLITATFLVLMAFAASAGTRAQIADKKVITLAMAKIIAAAAEAEANKIGLHESIAVLDDGGHPIYFQRGDGSQLATVDVSAAKARTALLFQRPSKSFEDVAKSGAVGIVTLPGVVAVEGGVPLLYQGTVIGAIGASGGTPVLDGQVAAAGAAAMPH